MSGLIKHIYERTWLVVLSLVLMMTATAGSLSYFLLNRPGIAAIL